MSDCPLSTTCIGYCFTCDLQGRIRKSPTVACLRCNGDFVELFELTPENNNPTPPRIVYIDPDSQSILESDSSNDSQPSNRFSHVRSTFDESDSSNDSQPSNRFSHVRSTFDEFESSNDSQPVLTGSITFSRTNQNRSNTTSQAVCNTTSSNDFIPGVFSIISISRTNQNGSNTTSQNGSATTSQTMSNTISQAGSDYSDSSLNVALPDDTRGNSLQEIQVSSTTTIPRPSSIIANPSSISVAVNASTTSSINIITDENSSNGQSSKRPRLEDKETTSDDITCPICFDDWTNSGSHRLVSLKCGHLFGQSCIVRWIASNKKCAQCNAQSHMGDIRKIFAKALKASDTSELEAERKLRIEIQSKYNKLLRDISNTKDRMKNHNEPVFQAHRKKK